MTSTILGHEAGRNVHEALNLLKGIFSYRAGDIAEIECAQPLFVSRIT